MRYIQVRPGTFSDHVECLRMDSDLHRENVDSAADLAAYGPDARFFLSEDLSSGYAIVAGDMLKFVFSAQRGRGDEIVAHAVKNGARRLDCFEGHLSTLYARHGFVIVSRMANWDPEGPDVVDMERP